jgi:hypothetical protein
MMNCSLNTRVTDAKMIEPANTRSSQRTKEHSKLVIDGRDLLGFPFTEDAESYDISQTGISFYMKNRPWIEDSLEITIFSNETNKPGFYCGYKTRGTVVRTGVSHEGRQFVAARFEALFTK